MSILIVKSQSHNPFFNLALEDFLLQQMAGVQKDTLQAILYLWQNENTVVIGRNQNAWAECKTELLEAEGGRLARRTTGGGAVFHDLGNLNFSFLMPQADFDIGRNFQMIVDTVRRAGVPAERSGRNDILADGLKFSGNAFRIDRGVGLHHGTLLISSAFERVGRYLTVAPAKMQARGVASVRSRVTNLNAFRPDLDVAYWMDRLEEVFLETQTGSGTTGIIKASTQQPADVLKASDLDFRQNLLLQNLEEKFASWDWRFGETLRFDAELDEHLGWGHIRLGFKVEQGHISTIRFYSDALDSDWIAHMEHSLLNLPFRSAILAQAITASKNMPGGFGVSRAQMAQDLADLIGSQGW